MCWINGEVVHPPNTTHVTRVYLTNLSELSVKVF